jgi:hypothetical protein
MRPPRRGRGAARCWSNSHRASPSTRRSSARSSRHCGAGTTGVSHASQDIRPGSPPRLAGCWRISESRVSRPIRPSCRRAPSLADGTIRCTTACPGLREFTTPPTPPRIWTPWLQDWPGLRSGPRSGANSAKRRSGPRRRTLSDCNTASRTRCEKARAGTESLKIVRFLLSLASRKAVPRKDVASVDRIPKLDVVG